VGEREKGKGEREKGKGEREKGKGEREKGKGERGDQGWNCRPSGSYVETGELS
jgi:hypothetical protein